MIIPAQELASIDVMTFDPDLTGRTPLSYDVVMHPRLGEVPFVEMPLEDDNPLFRRIRFQLEGEWTQIACVSSRKAASLTFRALDQWEAKRARPERPQAPTHAHQRLEEAAISAAPTVDLALLVRQAVPREGATSVQISKATGIDPQVVCQVLRRLVAGGRLRRNRICRSGPREATWCRGRVQWRYRPPLDS